MISLRYSLETSIRPRLLVVAARHAMHGYLRMSILPKLLGVPMGAPLPAGPAVIEALSLREAAMERARRHHDASWRAADHVLLLAALMAESASCEGASYPPADGATGCCKVTRLPRYSGSRPS